MAEYNRRRYEENKCYWQQRYQENKDEVLARTKQWDADNKESRNAISQRWRDENRDAFGESVRRSKSKNIDRVLAENAQRHAARIQRTVSWIDKAAVAELYAEAKRLEAETGIKHHVDHIIPLRGALVSGLHTHHNLRVITAAENLKKSNRLEQIT